MVGCGISKTVRFQIDMMGSIIWGYIYIMLVYEIINIVANFQNWTLYSLSSVFAAALAIVWLWSLVVIIKERKTIKVNINEIKIEYLYYFVFVCLIMVQILLVWSNGAMGSIYDSTTYTGYATAALETGRLNRTEPYSGVETGLNFLEAFISTDMHAATVCKLTGMHPLIYVGRVLGAIEVILYNICAFEIAKNVFNKDLKKIIVAMMFMFAVNMGMGSIYTASNFMLYRGGEPKSMVANVGIPLMLYSLMILVTKIESKKRWTLMVLAEVVALSLSQSGWILIPVIITAVLLYEMLKEKKYIINYILCMIPSFVALFLMLKWRV